MANEKSGYTVLVTGGSGFLGQHVVGLLQTRAEHVTEIRVLDQEKYVNKTDFPESKPVRTFTGSILDKALIEEACTGVDCVMHLASIIDVSLFANLAKCQAVNVEGTRTILEACKKTGVKRLLYCSSAGVAMGVGCTYVDVTEEDTPFPERHLFPVYGQTKQQAEQLVIAANCDTLQTVAIRPVAIYGDYDYIRFVPAYANAFTKKTGYYLELEFTSKYIDAVYVGNVAWAFLKADDTLRRGKTEAAGEAYYLRDDTPRLPRFTAVENMIHECNVRRLPFMPPAWVKLWVLWFIFLVCRIISFVYPMNCPLGEWVFDIRETTWLVDDSKARRLLGYVPLYSPEEAKGRLVRFINSILKT